MERVATEVGTVHSTLGSGVGPHLRGVSLVSRLWLRIQRSNVTVEETLFVAGVCLSGFLLFATSAVRLLDIEILPRSMSRRLRFRGQVPPETGWRRTYGVVVGVGLAVMCELPIIITLTVGLTGLPTSEMLVLGVQATLAGLWLVVILETVHRARARRTVSVVDEPRESETKS